MPLVPAATVALISCLALCPIGGTQTKSGAVADEPVPREMATRLDPYTYGIGSDRLRVDTGLSSSPAHGPHADDCQVAGVGQHDRG